LALGAGLGNGRPESSRHPGHLRSTHLGTHVRESHSPHDTPAPSPYPGTRQADGRFHKRASVPVPAPPPLPTASVQSPRLATPATTAVSVVSYIRPYFPTHPRSYVSPRIGDVLIQIIASRSSTILPLAPVRCETAGHQEAVVGPGFVNHISLMYLL